VRGDQSFRVTEQIFSDTTDGRELLRRRKEEKICLRWEKGKLQIKEEISLLRIAYVMESYVSNVFERIYL
jgi:hypothetical protein